MIDTWSVELTSGFPMGAGIQLRSPEPGRITFFAPWDTSPRPLWYNFHVRGQMNRRVRFELQNADQCLGGPMGYRQCHVYPVYTTDDPSLPPSQRRWHRVESEALSYRDGVYAFEIDVYADQITVAHCYPYGLEELQEFLNEHHNNAMLRSDTSCVSSMGNGVPRLRIGKHHETPVIWITARIHAGEVSGSWALDGLLRWLLSGQHAAKWLLEHYQFHVFPLFDIDGVLSGWYGKERAPFDFNRSWLADSSWQEISALLKEFFSPEYESALLLDFHSPRAQDPNHIFLPIAETMPESQWKFCTDLSAAIARESPINAHLTPGNIRTPTYMGYECASNIDGVGAMVMGIPTICLEVSYGYLDASGGAVMALKDYHDFGAATGRALAATLKASPDAARKISQPTPLCHTKPTRDYAGTSFRGCIPWSPPHAATVKSQTENGMEKLVMEFDCAEASIDMALPPLQISGSYRYCLDVQSSNQPMHMAVTFLGIADSGLWLRWTAKADVTIFPSPQARRLEFKLAPPAEVRYVQASLMISGGPARFVVAPPLWI